MTTNKFMKFKYSRIPAKWLSERIANGVVKVSKNRQYFAIVSLTLTTAYMYLGTDSDGTIIAKRLV